MIKFTDLVILSFENIDKSTTSSIKNYSKDVLNFKDSLDNEKLMEFMLKNID